MQHNFDHLINIRQTDGFAKFLTFFHWRAINPRPNVFYYIRRIPYLGAIIKIEKINCQNINLKEIDAVAKKERALFVKIEPFADESQQKELDKSFLTYGYTHDTWPLTSTTTFIIDLNQSYDRIVSNYKSKFRYNLRLAENRHGLTAQKINGAQLFCSCHSGESRNLSSSLLRQFANLYNQRAREIKSETHSYNELLHMCKSYGDRLWLIYILNVGAHHGVPQGLACESSPYDNNKMISAALFLCTHDILHYWHNGSTYEGRKLFAPTLIIAAGIKLAQKLGCKIFDFEGIYDERFIEQTKRWEGFTRFKEGFGGEKIVFCRPYIKYYSPVFKFFNFLKLI